MTWKVTTDLMGSDHLPILILINENFQHHKTEDKVRKNIHNINWDKYKNTVQGELKDSSEKVDGLLTHNILISVIHRYLNDQHPYKTRHKTPKINKPVWWDTECLKLIAQRRLALHRFKKTKN